MMCDSQIVYWIGTSLSNPPVYDGTMILVGFLDTMEDEIVEK